RGREERGFGTGAVARRRDGMPGSAAPAIGHVRPLRPFPLVRCRVLRAFAFAPARRMMLLYNITLLYNKTPRKATGRTPFIDLTFPLDAKRAEGYIRE